MNLAGVVNLGPQEMMLLPVLAFVFPFLGIRNGMGTVATRLWSLILGACQWLAVVGLLTLATVSYVLMKSPSVGGSGQWDSLHVSMLFGLIFYLNVSLIMLALHGIGLYAYRINRDTIRAK